MTRISVYDTTLRDGTQREGISLSVEDKLKIARKLDELGVAYVEGGWPGANPKDNLFFVRAADELRLRNARLVAFGMTRRPGVAAPDATLSAVLAANTPAVALVGKSWRLHVTDVLRTTLEENLRMIFDSVAYARQQGREVIYDAEHFFDGFRDSPDYAMATLRAAAEGGAAWLALCDTNGGTLPHDVAQIVACVVEEFGERVGIHTHNDGELAVANTLAAVQAGARQVQGTINGYGERTGNANLCSIIPNLQLKMGYECVSEEQLARLTELSRYVAEVANLAHDSHLPYVGASSFAHKAGLHADAVRKVAASFEHIRPELVGNRQRVLVSELSGKGNVLAKIQQFGLDVSGGEGASSGPGAAEVRELVEKIKRLESLGFSFEAAEASFELLIRRSQPGYVAPFQVLDCLVLVEKRHGGEMIAEATVKLVVGGQKYHTAAEGNGPVNALDAAMRKVLVQCYPALAAVELVDYKVRVVDEAHGTAAVVRVSIESSDGHGTWTTVGSSTNIIEASLLALVDSLEYARLRCVRREAAAELVGRPGR